MDGQLPICAIIIASYNNEKYIIDAIESAISQDYPAKTITVVDDCSTDGSFDIIKDFMGAKVEGRNVDGEDIKIAIATKNGVPISLIGLSSNKGPSYARNIGIKANWANSHLFSILDSDDIYYKEKLSKSIACLLEDPERIGVVGTNKDIENLSTGNTIREFNEAYDFNRFQGGHNQINSNFLVSRLALETVELYDENLRLAEDLDLLIRISSRFMIINIAEALYKARITGNNISNNLEGYKKAWAYIAEKRKNI